MVINANNPVGNPVHGPETSPRVNEVRREKEDAPERHTARTEETPDYSISLSDASKKAVSELNAPQESGSGAGKSDLSENAAARLAKQTSALLAQTNVSIANQAIAQAVDLFT